LSKNTKTALVIGIIAVLALLIVPSFFGGWGEGWCDGWGMMGPGMMGGFGGWWTMLVLMILVPVLVVWAIVALVRGWNANTGQDGQSESAMDILKKRYARGEINKEEFEERKKNLL